VPFDGLTEEWRLVGVMQIEGRLSDALNKREAIRLSDVSWAPVDGSAGFTAVPGLKSIDPYDLVVVLAGEGTLPPLTETERAAHRVHKVPYDVALDAPPFKILGTVYMYPGSEPGRLLDRATELFIPVTDAVLLMAGRVVGDPERAVVLVNRSYLRGVEQIDKGPQLPGPKPARPAADGEGASRA